MISRVLRLLSPRDSPDTITIVAGADDTSAGDATELRWERNEDLGRCYVSFHVDQYWSPIGTIGDLAVGLSSFLLASSVVGLCVYSE